VPYIMPLVGSSRGGGSAESAAADLGATTRSLTAEEAHAMFGPGGTMICSACSRSLDPRSRGELGWKPTQLNMLSQVGEPRMLALAESGGWPIGQALPGQQINQLLM
jgi:hypothetical protein